MRIQTLVFALLFFVPLLTAGDVKIVPSFSPESVIHHDFKIHDGAFQTGLCSRLNESAATEVTCGDPSADFIVKRNLVVTRITLQIETVAWTTTEACDVDVNFGGVTAATFQVGNSALDALGNYENKLKSDGDLAVTTLSEGDVIQVKHSTASGANDYCNTGSSCACVAANAGYRTTIYGHVP